MSKSATVIQLLQARLKRAIRQRRENPSRSDILMIPVLALALDACGGGGSQRPTPPPPPPPPPPPAATITADATGTIDENADGATVVAVTTANATSVTVSDDRFEVADGNLKLKDGMSLDFEVAGSPIEVTITASGDGDSATHTVSVTVNDIDEVPSAPEARSDSVTIAENDMGASVTSLAAPSTDPEGEDVTYHVEDDRFEVDDSLVVKLKDGESLNHEDGPVTITITAMDPGGNVSAAATVTVNTSNVNEAPSIVVAAATVPDAEAAGVDPDLSVDENSDGSVPGGVVAHIALSDEDELDEMGEPESHTLTVSDGRFEVLDAYEQKWLKLKEGAALDHETEGSIDITVTVTDAGGLRAMQTVTITVNDVNEAPTVSVADGETPDGMPAVSTVAENTPGALLGAITLSDPDAEGSHTLSVSDDRLFETKQDDEGGWWLKLKDGKSLDHEASDGTVTVTVTVTDQDGLSGSDEVTITVTDVNEAPTMPSVRSNAVSIDENDTGAPVTVVEGGSDPEGDTFTYQVDNDHFEITDVGILKLKDDAALDFEAGATVTLIVTAVDEMNNVSDPVAVTVTVGDVHENSAPTISVSGSVTVGGATANSMVNENVQGQIVGLITLADVDAGDTHEVTVDSDHFEVIRPAADAPGAGMLWLKLKDDASFNYEEDGDEVTVTLTVTDNGAPALSGTTEFTVTVVDVNEAPDIEVTGGATVPNEAMTVSSLTVDENAMGKDLPPLALIEVMDPDADEALTGQPGADSIMISDSHFKVKLDPQDGLWLALNDDASLDHELSGGTVTVTVTYTDSGGLTASQDVTVTVNDVLEATGEGLELDADDTNLMAGDTISWEVNLSEVFDNAADGRFDYAAAANQVAGGNWDGEFPVLMVDTEVNEEGHVIGTITGAAIPAGVVPSVFTISITATEKATDDDESNLQSAVATFRVQVDDRNDDITAIKLWNMADGDGEETPNELYEVEVEENVSAETIFGRITVDDPDNDFAIVNHPHGQHNVDLDAASKAKGFFIKPDAEGGLWLAHAAGNPLDHETDALVTVTITATDMAGDDSSSLDQTVIVRVTDENEDPKGLDSMGGWWVTVDEDLDEESVTAGSWLNFALEVEDDDDDATTNAQPAFTDPDDGANGMLTYSLVSGPSWLEVVPATGVIQNKAETLPSQDSGTSLVTIRATDDGGGSDTVTFRITWATSGDANEDNDAPDLKGDDNTYREGSAAGTVVATFTVEDDDSGLAGHPFAPGVPMIASATGDGNSVDYATSFMLDQRGSSNVWDVKTTSVAVEALDHEAEDDITITINVADGAGGTGSLEINLDVDDRNEAPSFIDTAVTIPTVEQSADEVGSQAAGDVQTIFINLFDAWEDSDGRDDDDDLSFTVSSNVPWITVLHDPAEWGDINDKDDDSDGVDDVWGGSGSPESDDYVVILQIDRTGANNRQADVADGGVITLTARDDRGGPTATETIEVAITDENLPAANAVTIDGAPREGHYLTASFDKNKDPDLAGDAEAYQVVYTWSAVVDGSATVRQVGLSNRYLATQEDVGANIQVSVAYFELLPAVGGELPDLGTTAQVGGMATTDSAVLNTPDRGILSGGIMVNGTTGLTAAVTIIDEDGVPAAGSTGAPTYTWESSVNGVSGWQRVEDDADANSDGVPDADVDTELTLPVPDGGSAGDGGGLYYRVVVRYKDEQKTEQESEERLVSEAVKVGLLAAPSPAPSADANPLPGMWGVDVDTLGDNDTVVWQKLTSGTAGGADATWEDVGTGTTLNLVDYVGETVRAVVSHKDDSGGLTAPATPIGPGETITGFGVVPGPATATAPEAEDYVIAVEVDESGVVTTITGTVDLSEVFTDADGDTLTYTIAAGTAPADTVTDEQSPGIYIGANDQGLFYFDLNTGMLRYHTDETNGHDGDAATDAGGNQVAIVITATDSDGNTATANVGVRLNVAGDFPDTAPATATVLELTQAAADLVTLNVFDENSPAHDFGAYDWMVSDARFTIKPGETDSSQAVLAVVEGSQFAHTGADRQDGTLTLMITATEKGSGNELEHEVTVTVTNDTSNDTPAPPAPPPDPAETDVPGLKDDDGDNNDTDDSDNDGGWFPPDPGLMAIEDDLLDSFVLSIDDHIDVA